MLFSDFWRKPQTNGFQEYILFVADGSFTVDGGLMESTGVKTTPQKARFRDVKYARKVDVCVSFHPMVIIMSHVVERSL